MNIQLVRKKENIEIRTGGVGIWKGSEEEEAYNIATESWSRMSSERN
jgi:hypothetical protein